MQIRHKGSLSGNQEICGGDAQLYIFQGFGL